MDNTKIILDGITANELVSQLANSVKEMLTKKEPQPQEQKEEFLTRNETAKFLKVSLVTLWQWDNKGILKPHRIGTKVRYKKSDVLNCLNKENETE